MAFSDLIKPRHKSASRMLGYAATLNDTDGWAFASALWELRLTKQERAGLAWSAIRSLPASVAHDVLAAAHGRVGPPLPPFLSISEDARWWASTASATELKCIIAAAFNALDRRDQVAFLDFATDRRAAA